MTRSLAIDAKKPLRQDTITGIERERFLYYIEILNIIVNAHNVIPLFFAGCSFVGEDFNVMINTVSR